MLVDRHLGRDRVSVKFLGREASFLRTPALLAYMTGAPILPCFIERIGAGRFAAQPGTPIRVAREGPRDAAILAATQEIADALAVRVRAHPEDRYHFYRYWDAQRDSNPRAPLNRCSCTCSRAQVLRGAAVNGIQTEEHIPERRPGTMSRTVVTNPCCAKQSVHAAAVRK